MTGPLVERKTIRGLTTRDRLDRILNLLADSIGPLLRDEERVADFEFWVGDGIKKPLAELRMQADFTLDAQRCLKIIYGRSRALFFRHGAARENAAKLLVLRNAHAHGKDISADDVQVAGEAARDLLADCSPTAAEEAADLVLPPSIAYVADLRRELIAVAGRRTTINYTDALKLIDLPDDDFGYRQLYRQLNVLAAKQLILGEPQLCALVVRADKGIPGDGFFWVVDLPRNATEDDKRVAHQVELERVYG
jgi:hypothetical protein